jgi:sugar phosphate isomerase/epimerase
MRFAFCNEGFGDRAWPAVCAAIAAAGYDGVEIAPYTFADDVHSISPSQRAEMRRVAQEAGLEIVGLHWLLVKPEGLHLCHPDKAVRTRTRDYLCHLADFCADLGGKVMVFGSPKQRGMNAGASADQAWGWAKEAFTAMLPLLAERKVTLCFEPLTTAETDFVTTAAEGRRLVEEIDHPRFRLLLDVKAMSAEDEPVPELLRENARVLGHVHANDANLQGPGFGDVDFRPILQALRELRYDGYVSVEPFEFVPDAEAVARRSCRYLKDSLSEK